MSWDTPEYWEMLIRRSLSRFFLLRVLFESPCHGYQLKEAVRKVAKGCCDPTDAMIYPAIKELVDNGYVDVTTESQGARERKVCTLTPRGVAAYTAAATAWKNVLPHVEEAIQVAEGSGVQPVAAVPTTPVAAGATTPKAQVATTAETGA